MAGGNLQFQGNSSGTVANQGAITSTNGDVVLVGKSVSNSGQISAPNGTAGLAAGDQVVLSPSSDQTVQIAAGSGDATNSGTIAAAQVELNAAGGNVYALATNNGGVIRATGTATKNGRVFLTSGGDISTQGTVSAVNSDGSGGEIEATGNPTTGTATIGGGLDVSATAPLAVGGTIIVTASAIHLLPIATIKADGGANGGVILLGGDRHGGSDPTVKVVPETVPNAMTNNVDAGATLSANGGAFGGSGNGGHVIVWSNDTTSLRWVDFRQRRRKWRQWRLCRNFRQDQSCLYWQCQHVSA